MPPHRALWDYHPPKHHNLPHGTLAKGSRDFTRWCTTELGRRSTSITRSSNGLPYKTFYE
jgi:hypothetical protein